MTVAPFRRALIASAFAALCLLPTDPQALDAARYPGKFSVIEGDAGPARVMGRSLAARVQEEINAFDNGVVCDGVSDNAAAFAAIKAKLTTGQTLYFPPSPLPCMTSAPISIGKPPPAAPISNVTIRAIPGTVTIKALPGNTGSVVLLALGWTSNVLVDGLSFDGGGRDHGNVNPVLQGYNVDGLAFDRITLVNTRGSGVNFSIARNSGVRRSVFRNIGNRWQTTKLEGDRQQAVQFSCQGCSDATVNTLAGNFANDNSFKDIGLDPMSFGDAVNVSAVGNRCEMSNDQIAQVAASAYAGCVYTTNVRGAVIAGNYAIGATGNAFDIHNTKGFAISGNYIEGSGQAGIGVFGSYGSISGNTILNSGLWPASPYRAGIALAGPLKGLSIQSNLIADARDAPAQPFGIQGFAGTCTDCLIANNAISGMATAEIGGYLTGPTVLAAKAGGTGLTGGAWTPWTPSFTATGGTGVTFTVVSAAYEQTGKTLRGRLTLQVNDTGARPSEISFSLPGGQVFATGAAGSAINFSTGASLQLASSGTNALRLRPLTPGGPFLDASGQSLAVSFEAEVQ